MNKSGDTTTTEIGHPYDEQTANRPTDTPRSRSQTLPQSQAAPAGDLHVSSTNSGARTWLVLAFGDDRSYAGNVGYADDISRLYRFDSDVQNHSQVSANDVFVIRDRQQMLGVAVVATVTASAGRKTRQRCPTCGVTMLTDRVRKTPRFRCSRGHEFQEPRIESVECTLYEAAFRSYSPAVAAIPIALLTDACVRRSTQMSIQQLDPDAIRWGLDAVEQLAATERFLERAVKFYGPERQLRTIQPDDLLAWLAHLAQPTATGSPAMTPGSVRHHMNALSGLMRRAQRTGAVPPGFNPVALLETDERPEREASTTRMLEVPEAARLLNAARTYRPSDREPEMHLAYPMLAAFLLTGGRADEVLGLDLSDIDFARNVVRFRKNQWRRGRGGKTDGAERTVPLWPQLREILELYLTTHHLDLRLRFDTTLLLPSSYTGGRITDIRGLCDRVARRAGLEEGAYRSRAFRVTYATARLQTLDHGAPIARKTVEVELGHKSGAMLERVYGRLGAFRCRSETVEYRLSAERDGIAEGNPESAQECRVAHQS